MRASICLALLLLAAPAAAQDEGEMIEAGSEIVVTASRISRDDDDEEIPLIGLRRTADFAVQQVSVVGDTRDTPQRRDEIFRMVQGAIALANRRGDIDLATGAATVQPLTLGNYKNLPISPDNRPDTDRVSFLVKTRLVAGSDAKAALERIEAFIKAVPAVGRAEMRREGELTLSVVAPEQYRGQVLDLVAADARATAARLGPEYAVEATGLDRTVSWSRASLTEVFLYVPYRYSVVPARR
jgi:acetylornithine deacetylase/succinyl-diaminopimelate desuccinylase-like protein